MDQPSCCFFLFLSFSLGGHKGNLNTVTLIIRDEAGTAQYMAVSNAAPVANGTWTSSATLKNPFFMEIDGGVGCLLRYGSGFSNWS